VSPTHHHRAWRRFFPALQYLSTSKIAIAVAGNFAFAMALCLYRAMVKVSTSPRCACAAPPTSPTSPPHVETGACSTLAHCYIRPSTSAIHRYLAPQVFLGQLREAEIERINDRISQAIMETCLAMTIFREEFNVEFCTMFTVLTFIKVHPYW